MTSKQKNALHRLKAIENKAYAAAVRDCVTTADALAKYGEDAAYRAWIKTASAVCDFANTLPFGGR